MRCVTINLGGLGRDWFGRRSEALHNGLRPLAPDVICFQEAAIRSHEPVYNQAAAVGHALGLNFVAFSPYGNPIEVMSHEQGGVAVAARWPMAYVENRRLQEGMLDAPDNRVSLLVRLLAPWGDLHVVNTHLSWRPEEADIRLVQLGIVLDYLSHAGLCEPFTPLVFAGDLNAQEPEQAIGFAAKYLRDCFRTLHPEAPGHTWSRINPLAREFPAPDRRLDYIFVPRSAHIKVARVVLDEPAPVFASDHFGVLAEVEFPEE